MARRAEKSRSLGGGARADAMLAALKRGGLKMTPQRLAIVRELADDESHPTAQELYERLRASMPTMSFATVYNTLGALSSQGAAVARTLSAGATRFDPKVEPHHHAVCDQCGRVLDVFPHAGAASTGGENLAAVSPPSRGDGGAVATMKTGVPHGFVVHAVEQIYRGVCASCRARGPS
jgi:Fur family peroxide stress response transcriptional regulator